MFIVITKGQLTVDLFSTEVKGTDRRILCMKSENVMSFYKKPGWIFHL